MSVVALITYTFSLGTFRVIHKKEEITPNGVEDIFDYVCFAMLLLVLTQGAPLTIINSAVNHRKMTHLVYER